MFKKYDNEIRLINVDALTYVGDLENLKEVEDRENYHVGGHNEKQNIEIIKLDYLCGKSQGT